MKRLLNAILILFAMSVSVLTATAADRRSKTQANVPVEITVTAQNEHSDPFNTVQVDVLFTSPTGEKKLVPTFWDGGKTWKARYSSATPGKHRWQARCNRVDDKGLHGPEGTVEITKYRGDNPLFKHGPIQVAEDKRHFQHADGTPFFWLGDTWWMGLCHRLHFPDEFKELTNDRKAKGFNVIQIVAGLYPDMHPFDPRGANEAGFPWETNYTAIRPQYFDAADARLRYLIDEGFTPCIVGAWGYFLPWIGVEKAKQHWRELIARYGSWPVVWCIAGEANLPWYLAKNFPYDDRSLVHGWTDVARYVRETDPFHRMVTIHPTGIGKLNSRWAIDDAALIDFDMLQTPHGEREAVSPTVNAFEHAYHLPPAMPVLDGEASYEMLNGQIAARWTWAMFWLCMINGAAGHTYGANGIWQCNRRDQPHGASPHGGNYGTIAWNDAMRLPGSQQVGNGKKFLEQFPWQRCVPQSDTVMWEKTTTNPWGHWIWFPEGDPRVAAPIEPRFFRRAFQLKQDPIGRATLTIAADDKAAVWINGAKICEFIGWQTPQQFDVTKHLRPGKNVIAIRAENLPASVSANPAGLLATLQIQDASTTNAILSDASWTASALEKKDWNEVSFSDSTWKPAKEVAKYGEGPWGRVTEDNQSFAPYALGITDELRIVYSLISKPVLIQRLRPSSPYRVTRFDPVTGRTSDGEVITSNADGDVLCSPQEATEDWVISLQLAARPTRAK